MTDCDECARPMVPTRTWRAADQTQRIIWQAAGHTCASGRGLCVTCYKRLWKNGNLIDHARSTMPTELVVEEWFHLDHTNGSRAERCRHLAKRLGMTPDALEKALDRAGVRSHIPQQGGVRRAVAA